MSFIVGSESRGGYEVKHGHEASSSPWVTLPGLFYKFPAKLLLTNCFLSIMI